MLESPVNAAALGEVIVEEADDGTTALKALEAAAGARVLGDVVGSRSHNDSSQDDKVYLFEEMVQRGEGVVTQTREHGTLEGPHLGFDLVFIDFVMTTMNGPEAVQIMRRDLKFTGGIIGVTGNALPADLTYFKDCGADLVITKPLTNKKLVDAIQAVAQRKKKGSNIIIV